MALITINRLLVLLTTLHSLRCVTVAGTSEMKRDKNEEEGDLFEGDILLGQDEDLAVSSIYFSFHSFHFTTCTKRKLTCLTF